MNLPINKNKFNIGTSGWSYDGWIGNFYPEKIKSALVLPYYATLLDSVELNNSFYRIPSKKNVANWVGITPPHFVFSCKANRYITHLKKLEDTKETVETLLDVFSNFEEKLGPILFQFPPYWPIDIPRLHAFIKHLPKRYLYTFEFRHKSWFCEELFELLNKYNLSLCFYNHKMFWSPEIITGQFIYIRMHGPNEEAYQGSYEETFLQEYAQKLIKWRGEGKAIYCYFDNDAKAQAPKNAQRLRAILKDIS